jgi:hypothetical protein
MPASDDTRRRAKAVIVEIIRQHGGSMQSKTHLFKAFWKANVAAAQATGTPLTDYPIVRMPHGPGIHNVSHLLSELIDEDAITMDRPSEDPYDPFEFTIQTANAYEGDLSDNDRKAVSRGIDAVRGKSAKQISDESHRESRAWNAARNGEALDIYLDAIPEDEFARRSDSLRRIGAAVDAAFNSPCRTNA